MNYLVELAEVRQTKTGKDYLFVQGNTGLKRVQCYVWGSPLTSDYIQNLKHKVLLVCRQKEMEGFVSINFGDVTIANYDDLPQEHPIRTIKLKGDYDSHMLLKCIHNLAKEWKFPQWVSDYLNTKNFEDEIMQYEKVCAGKSVHHPWVNGLSTHTMEALCIADSLMKISFIKAKPWVVLMSIIWHDWGKLKEYAPETWEYTSSMFLKGHVYMSAVHAREELNKQILKSFAEGKVTSVELPEFQREIEHVEHCILAHHSLKEYGSPVVPATIEAYLVTTADLISARNNMFSMALDNEKNFYLGTTVQKL